MRGVRIAAAAAVTLLIKYSSVLRGCPPAAAAATTTTTPITTITTTRHLVNTSTACAYLARRHTSFPKRRGNGRPLRDAVRRRQCGTASVVSNGRSLGASSHWIQAIRQRFGEHGAQRKTINRSLFGSCLSIVDLTRTVSRYFDKNIFLS